MATVVPQLEEVREKLVDAVLVVCAVLMVPTAVLSWFRVYTIGVQPIMFIESAIAIAMCTVARRGSVDYSQFQIPTIFLGIASGSFGTLPQSGRGNSRPDQRGLRRVLRRPGGPPGRGEA